MSNNSYNLVAQDNVLGFSFFDQFEILRLVDLSIGGNLDLSITNSTVFLLVAFFVLFFLFKGNNENGNIVPGRYQSILEGVYVLVYDMVKENMGKDGARYFPFMLSLFLFLLIINFVGLIPYTFTPTSHGAISFGLSISIFVGCAVIAFATHGMDYFSMFFPPGVAAPIAGFLVAVEIISYFAKPISLGLRLAANITAGHLLFTILASFIWKMLMAGGALAIGSLFPLAITFFITVLETAVAFIQAYVFCLLTIIYLNDSFYLH